MKPLQNNDLNEKENLLYTSVTVVHQQQIARANLEIKILEAALS
jgi:hypothetical protein